MLLHRVQLFNIVFLFIRRCKYNVTKHGEYKKYLRNAHIPIYKLVVVLTSIPHILKQWVFLNY